MLISLQQAIRKPSVGLWVGLTTPKVTAGTLSFFIGQKEINLDSSFFFFLSFPGQLFVAMELWHMESLSYLHLARGPQGLYMAAE